MKLDKIKLLIITIILALAAQYFVISGWRRDVENCKKMSYAFDCLNNSTTLADENDSIDLLKTVKHSGPCYFKILPVNEKGDIINNPQYDKIHGDNPSLPYSVIFWIHHKNSTETLHYTFINSTNYFSLTRLH